MIYLGKTWNYQKVIFPHFLTVQAEKYDRGEAEEYGGVDEDHLDTHWIISNIYVTVYT